MYSRLTKELKDHILDTLKAYFIDERDEDIGDIAAINLLDFISKEIGPHFYNLGVNDAKDMLEQKMMNLEEDIESLKRSVPYRNE